MKITIEIDTASIIEDLEEAVPNPTGGKETEESLQEYVGEYLDELKEYVEEWILKKLIYYHTH